jgi:hypothetical protein
MRSVLNMIAFIALIAACTAFVGWWTVPLVSAAWTYAAPRRAGVLYAALAGAFAWGVLLIIMSQQGAITPVDTLLSQVLGVPPRSLLALTLAYAALLAGSAALVTQAVKPPQRLKRSSA